MRARNIKPAFWVDDALAGVPASGRLLYLGLECLADFRGVLEDRPLVIRAQLFPYDQDTDVPELLRELENRGRIARFATGGVQYIAIPRFELDQSPHAKERASGSRLPEPPRVETGPTPGSSGPTPGSTGATSDPVPLILDSRFLISDSGSLNTDSGSSTPDVSDYSERMYARHTRKKGKPLVEHECLKIARKHGIQKLAEIDRIHAQWCVSPEWQKENGRYVPGLDRFLADEGWTATPRRVEVPLQMPVLKDYWPKFTCNKCKDEGVRNKQGTWEYEWCDCGKAQELRTSQPDYVNERNRQREEENRKWEQMSVRRRERTTAEGRL